MRRHFLEDEFDVVKVSLKFAQHFINQRPVFHDQEVRVENAGILCSNRLGNALLHLQNLRAREDQRRFEAADLIRNLGWLNPAARNLVALIAHHMKRSSGDAGGNPDALQTRLLFCVIAAHQKRVAQVSRSG